MTEVSQPSPIEFGKPLIYEGSQDLRGFTVTPEDEIESQAMSTSALVLKEDILTRRAQGLPDPTPYWPLTGAVFSKGIWAWSTDVPSDSTLDEFLSHKTSQELERLTRFDYDPTRIGNRVLPEVYIRSYDTNALKQTLQILASNLPSPDTLQIKIYDGEEGYQGLLVKHKLFTS